MSKQKNNLQPSQQDLQPLLQSYQTGQFTQAEAAGLKLLKKFPNGFMVHHVLGSIYGQQGKVAQAVKSVQKALTIDPTAAELHLNVGILLDQLGQ